ncbi:hypothetical protein [Pulveribacter sp.]|uniref:hypothetical protein n=1 Tax=Pulveribacter sp. TaxID=2678893 RepID=UPI00289BFA89|nr:hypothetical protein [Pulveribacter sp.]
MTKRIMALATAAAITALLAGCGGGGGGNDNGSGGDTLNTAQLQGRWATAAGAAKAYTAVVLPAAANTADAWLLAQDASRLVKLTVAGDGSAQGRAYALGQGGSQAVSGQVTAALSASPKTFTVSDTVSGATQFAQVDALSTPAAQADAAGTWSATTGGQAHTVRWTVDAAGALAGNSTTGCTYAGQVTAKAGASAYGVQVSESCPDGAKTVFGGVATLNAAKSGMTVAVASADAAQGAALFFAK